MTTHSSPDSITASVIRSAMETVCFEMATYVSRTATTPILNQSNERNATILDQTGRLAALSVGIPQFMLSSTLPVRMAIDFFGEELRPGDVIVANDPYYGGGHLPDFNVFSPVFDDDGELVRYESPSPVQARYVTRDVEHYGQSVPAGGAILLLTASANRDERRFPDADRFDIHRKIEHHLAFGYGIHFCLGSALARLEGRIALDEVLKRFPSWEVDWDNAIQARTSTVRGWERLPVVVG